MNFTMLLALFLMLPFSLKGDEKPFDKSDCKYYLAVCAFFQDEEPYLKEWLEYYLQLNVEHFYLFNNSSHDNFRQVLAPYLEQGVVELMDWPSKVEGGNWMPDQEEAYNYCIKKCEKETYWLAICDIDEFFVPIKKPDLPSYLAQFDDDTQLGGIQVNMQLFGTSKLASLPKDKLLIESLIYRAPWNYVSTTPPDNRVVKSIVRPHAVSYYRIHEGDYKEIFYVYPGTGFDRFQPIDISEILLCHYWTGAEDNFYEVKIARRLRFMRKSYKEKMLKKRDELNQVEDRIMDRFIPELRSRVGLP